MAYVDDSSDLAHRLKAIRETYRMSVREFAKFVDMQPTVYFRYEQGTTGMNVSTLIKLCNKLDCDIHQLIRFQTT